MPIGFIYFKDGTTEQVLSYTPLPDGAVKFHTRNTHYLYQPMIIKHPVGISYQSSIFFKYCPRNPKSKDYLEYPDYVAVDIDRVEIREEYV